MQWYSEKIDDIYKLLDSSISGLSTDRVDQKKQEYGENKLPEGRHITYFEIFLNQFKSPLIYILLISTLTVFLMGDYESGITIGIVLILNSIIGTVQEGKAENTLNALKKFVTTQATVIRNGNEIIVEDYDIVPGDIILLKEGDKVPSDARLLNAQHLKVDESALTGESESVQKNCDTLSEKGLSPQDQLNMVFRGTYIVGGTGKAIIVSTGSETLIGQISLKLQTLDTDVPLKKQIKALSKVLIIIISIVVLITFFVGIYSGIEVVDMFGIVVAMAVSVIPEGLPVVVTLILATGVSRMTKRNALIKNLQAVEALGQADIIAVDKTGTVTFNQMQVKEVSVSSGTYQIQGSGYEPKGDIELDGNIINYTERTDLMMLGKIASLTADAHISYVEETKLWKRVSGDPTEVALLVLSKKMNFDKNIQEIENPKILEMPFSSENRFHATLNTVKGKKIFFVAGAPETLIEASISLYTDSGNVKFSENEKHKILQEMKRMSDKGLRIVAFAISDNFVKDENSNNLPELTFVGIAGIEDAIRPEVYDAVKRSRGAGIKVVMITGDHVDTARAIAKTTGIFQEGDHILTGKDLNNLSPKELTLKIKKTSVFARVTPDDKMKIINAYKSAGLVIAMTGDGVNDALSLASADLGVAMGKVGTEVAKGASDIILLDDNFGSIVYAVEEGRNIYKTIKKVLMYLLSTGLGEIFAIGGAVLLGLEMPFSASQIIWLNFITDGFLVVALAMEPKDLTVLSQKMKKSDQKLVNKEMLVRMFIMGFVMMLGTVLLFNNYSNEGFLKASTMALTVLAAYQWFNIFNCRSDKKSVFRINLFSNKYLIIAFICVVVAQLFAVYTTPFNRFLNTTPISGYDWVVVIAIGSSIIFVDEIYKLIKSGLNYKKI